jgi:hypothetical protein
MVVSHGGPASSLTSVNKSRATASMPDAKLSRWLTQTEMVASQRDDFAITGVIAGLDIDSSLLDRAMSLDEALQQRCLRSPWPNDQNTFAPPQGLVDATQEGWIIAHPPVSNGIGPVVQMSIRQMCLHRSSIHIVPAQKENFGDAMIDPDDGVVMSAHGWLSSLIKLVIQVRIEWHPSGIARPQARKPVAL